MCKKRGGRMTVERAVKRVKCDASGCANKCDYVIVNKKFVFDGNFYLCSNCLNTLYNEIAKFIIPKSLKPIYKKGGKNEKY